MILELVTEAYMLAAPVGLMIVCHCIAELTRERQERAGRALYAGFKRWLTDGGGGIRGKPLAVPLSSLRFPTAPTGVQRIGDMPQKPWKESNAVLYAIKMQEYEAAMERWHKYATGEPPPPPPVNPENREPDTIRRSAW